MGKEIFKKMFSDGLPKKTYRGKEVFDWKNSIGSEVKFIYDDIEGMMEIVGYNKHNCKLNIKYKNNNIVISSWDFLECKFGRVLGKITGEFKVPIGKTFKDKKRDIIIIDREYREDNANCNRKWYKFRCKKCNYESWVIEGSLMEKEYGCPCCCNPPKVLVEGVNDIPTTAPWMIKFFQGGISEAMLYTKGSGQKIKPVCPDCGRIKDKEIKINDLYHYKSIRCSCGDGQSYPEKFIFNVLEQLKIAFISEYSPEWIGRKLYDFYFELKNNKYIVEMDGTLGHGKSVHGKSNKTIEETKQDDIYKDMMAERHDIEVIRIDSDKSELEFIKNNILKSKLSEIFNLSNIDWIQCETFALSNRVKEACEIKRDNPDMTTTEIGEIMNLSKPTIRKYLIKGNEIGWCNYDPKEEKRKVCSKNGKSLGKPVEIFKDEQLLGIFESASELERQSEGLFGVRLSQSKIYLVCYGKRNHHKGFKFKSI